ncbi:hypothetical protein V3C99_006612 [Haemonchus contortus]|uniref:Uncharacterized protein n=1 Tax=Haemonchus contortus TaxID=6289 RepID=A0A7I4YT04_HAECO
MIRTLGKDTVQFGVFRERRCVSLRYVECVLPLNDQDSHLSAHFDETIKDGFSWLMCGRPMSRNKYPCEHYRAVRCQMSQIYGRLRMDITTEGCLSILSNGT